MMNVMFSLALLMSLTLISAQQEKAEKAVTVETLKQFLAAFNAHDLDSVGSSHSTCPGEILMRWLSPPPRYSIKSTSPPSTTATR
jgi:hypothetical protein